MLGDALSDRRPPAVRLRRCRSRGSRRSGTREQSVLGRPTVRPMPASCGAHDVVICVRASFGMAGPTASVLLRAHLSASELASVSALRAQRGWCGDQGQPPLEPSPGGYPTDWDYCVRGKQGCEADYEEPESLEDVRPRRLGPPRHGGDRGVLRLGHRLWTSDLCARPHRPPVGPKALRRSAHEGCKRSSRRTARSAVRR